LRVSNRIDLVASFEPTVNENIVGCEFETIRQQVFECVGANCTTFLDGFEQRRWADQPSPTLPTRTVERQFFGGAGPKTRFESTAPDRKSLVV
jgi:hypothetical protein